MVTYITELFQL